MKISQTGRILLIIIVLFKCLPTFALDAYSPAIPEIAADFKIVPTAIMDTLQSKR